MIKQRILTDNFVSFIKVPSLMTSLPYTGHSYCLNFLHRITIENVDLITNINVSTNNGCTHD